MKRLISLTPIIVLVATGSLVNAQTTTAPVNLENGRVPNSITNQFDQATAETGNAWTRFVDKSKQAITQPFDQSSLSGAGEVGQRIPNAEVGQPMDEVIVGGNFVQKINDGTKRFVENTKQALTPKFNVPNITPPRITPPKLTAPMFKPGAPSLNPSGAKNFFKNILPITGSNSDKSRRSLLTPWLPAAREPAPKQPPTLGDWLSQDRPQ